MPDLAHALVAAAREHERGARSRRRRGAPGDRRKRQLRPMPARERPVAMRPSRGIIGRSRCVRPVGDRVRELAPSCHVGAQRVAKPFATVRHCEKAHAYTPPDPDPAWSRSRVVTEFYRQYLAVAVFVVAAFGMVGAMLGDRPDPASDAAAGREVHHLRIGLRPAAALRADERPLLHLRPAVRDLRRRGRVHLPVGGRRRRAAAGSG